MSSETVGTIGGQKQDNYALRQNMSRDEFIAEVTEGLAAPPAYFPLNVKLNREGYEAIEDVLNRGTRALSPREFETAANETGAVILDVRGREAFAAGHVPRSIFIGIDGSFAPWVGALIADVHQPILLVVEPGREEEVITRLARVGFDQTLGYLAGGFAAWKADGRQTDSVCVVDVKDLSDQTPTLDVRKPTEYANGHLAYAQSAPLAELNQHISSLPSERTFYLHCQSGYRSMIASSILKSRGIHNVCDVRGGYKAIVAADIPVTTSSEIGA